MKSKMQTTIPCAPHPDTLRNPDFTILDATGTRLLCWCPRHLCGAIYHGELRIWSMESGISFGEFLIALKARNYVVDDSDDLARWIETCAASEVPRPNAPGGTC